MLAPDLGSEEEFRGHLSTIGDCDGDPFPRGGCSGFPGIVRAAVSQRPGLPDENRSEAWCIGAYLYYALFYKTRLVPRWMSVWGLAGITLVVAASILVLFRQVAPMSTAQLIMSFPVALQEIVLAVWLIVKGFSPSASPRRGVHGRAVPQRSVQ